MSCDTLARDIAVHDQTAFTALAEEWCALLERSYDSRLFLTPTWHELWWEHFGSDRPYVLTFRSEEGTLNAVLPLQTLEDGGQRVLTFVGDPNVADYMDGIAEKQEAALLLRSLWSEALESLEWDRLELRHVPSTSPLIDALKTVGEERRLSVRLLDDEVCPVAILCNNWEGYLQMLSKKQRHEIRRKLRRAQEGVEWNWRTSRSQEELDRDLPIFFRLHEISGQDKARFMTGNMRVFFHSLGSAMLKEGLLRLSVFQREGVDVASTMSFVYRGRFMLYNSGYDTSYAAYSPGIAAVALAMQDAIAEKAVAFDFLSGDEAYKYQFGAANTRTCRVDVKA